MKHYSKADIDAVVEFYKKNHEAFNSIYTNMIIKEGLHPSSDISLYYMFGDVVAEFLGNGPPVPIKVREDIEMFVIGVGMHIMEKHKLKHIHMLFENDYEFAVAMRSYNMTKEWLCGRIVKEIEWPEIRKEDY